MKKIFNIIIALASALMISGCEDFLDRSSLTTLDDETYWAHEGALRLFVNQAYGSYFAGYSRTWTQTYAPGVYSSGEYSDDRTTTNAQGNILIDLPTSNITTSESRTGNWLARRGSNMWDYSRVRKWNLLMSRIDEMKEDGKLNEEAYGHWMGVARFFRGWEYSRLVESFGDVPYFDHDITDLSSGEEYSPRTPRTDVMNYVLDDFKYAIENVRKDDGLDYVNKYVVGTIASRCMLFEGTWYIYHKNDPAMATAKDVTANSKKFLEAARDFAQVVINEGGYRFDAPYRDLFCTYYDRPAYGELLMYRVYNRSVNSASTHCIASFSNGDENQTQSGNLSTLKAWICNDGRPYASTTVENKDSWRLQDMVVNRDPRFEATFWDEPKGSATGLYVEKFCGREGVKYSYQGGSRPDWIGGSCYNENGYPVVRYAETVLNWIEAKAELAVHHGGAAVTQDDLDKSINAIRQRPLDDVAKAKGVKQTAPLTLAMVADMNDPERTSIAQQSTLGYKTTGFVDPLLWEIRRERRMEFFLEQYRVLDIRRWGQLELMLAANNPDLGIGGYVELDLAATIGEKKAAETGRPEQTTNLKKTLENQGYDLLTKDAAEKGNVKIIPFEGYNADGSMKLGSPITFNGTNYEQMRGFLIPNGFADRDALNVDVRNYLEPLCTNLINQYKDKGYEIEQNPGWPSN